MIQTLRENLNKRNNFVDYYFKLLKCRWIYLYFERTFIVEKRRIRLDINGIVCGLITEESDEYMNAISDEVGSMMNRITAASPFITREAAALTVALNYCDESRKGDRQIGEMKQRNRDMEKRMIEAERIAAALKKENSQLWEETSSLLNNDDEKKNEDTDKLKERIKELEMQVALLNSAKTDSDKPLMDSNIKLKNPLRQYEGDDKGFVPFFEKKDE